MLQLRILFYEEEFAYFVATHLRHEYVCQHHIRLKLKQSIGFHPFMLGTQHFHAFVGES